MQDFLNTTRRSIAWLRESSQKGSLEMKPPFQRNPVWSDKQKAYLIDTILRGYPVPEIYMQEEVDESGNEKHILVDGQQRVRACLEFIEGSYSLDQEESPEWADMTFEDLSKRDKKQIFGYSFIVRQLPSVPEEELRGIFKRLNRNVVALNKQELRHSTYWGDFITLMENLANHPYWEGTGIFTANDIRRMLDVEFISELAIGWLHGPQNKKASLDKWYEAYEKEFEHKKEINRTFISVLGELDQIIPDIRQTRWRKKSDFYTLFLVFAIHQDELPLTKGDRQAAARKLRTFGDAVTKYLAEGGRASAAVKKYSRAVERAASDLGNRRARFQALEETLGVFHS